MLQYNPSISGSLNITGSLIISNGMIGTVNGVDVQIFSSSINQVITGIQAATGSQEGRLGSIESFTSSTSARLNSIETISASNLSRLNSLEEKTGSLATTGSNVFSGSQTITGSLYISADLIVQGSSSLQNITASAVSIGTNIVNLNTANPAIRYAGLSIGDSGSIGSSGSFLYDSVQDEMIFIHRGANTTVTSSVTLMGPQTYDNVGNETYPTSNIIQKGTGNEHLVDSCIFDNGTTVCINANLKSDSNACITSICSPSFVGGTISGTTGVFSSSTTAANFISDGTAFYAISLKGRAADNYGAIGFYSNNGATRTGYIQYGTICGGQVNITGDGGGSVTLDNRGATITGAATFSSTLKVGGATGNFLIDSYTTSKIGIRSWTDIAGTTNNFFLQNNASYNYGIVGVVSASGTATGDVYALGYSPSAGTSMTPVLNWTSGGNVGINTTNFGERLNIGCGSAIAWQNTCNCQKWHIQYNSADGLNFVESAVADFRLFLKAGGNVGVGLSTPTAQLHICSAYSQTPLVVQGGGNGNVPIACFYSGVNQLALLDDNGNLIIGSTSFSTRGTVTTNGLMVSGRVGIGTACPTLTLDVSSPTGAVISATTRTNDGCCSEIRAGWTSPNGGVMRMGYYPSTAVGYIDNTYAVVSGQPFGDIQFRQIISGTPCIRLIIKGDGGNVGIGTSSPSERLHIYGAGSGPEIRLEGTWGSHYIRAYNDNWNFLTNGGRVAISILNNGDVRNYQNTTTWQQSSDIRIKENINTIENALNVITSLNPVSFNYKQEFAEKNNWDDNMKLNNIGFIAQEFETVFPKYVSMNNYTLGDALIEDFKSIDTGHLVAYLVKGMQEQQCTICSQASMISTLKSCLGIS